MDPRTKTVLSILLLLTTLPLLGESSLKPGAEQVKTELVEPDEFISLLFANPEEQRLTFDKINGSWQPGYAVMVLELLYFSRQPATSLQLLEILEAKTGQSFSYDIQSWYEWLWSQPPTEYPRYAEFKSLLYRMIDPKFATYFAVDRPADIRLDEVRWGGVLQDGIPPLRSPEMITASKATYLEDDNVVFGLEINGDARAYPKRILAWHELFTDTIGGLHVAGVYCTLCGTVILYETTEAGVDHQLGTSGFLYRSNKLMYDQNTQSLWNTLWGQPAIGPLVGRDIQLKRRGVVTTTWGEWRRRHPESKVLSLNTGHDRDYGEGAAYREYFATDELMFNVPKLDRRLKNKDEVLTLLDEQGGSPLAISARFLEKKQLYHDQLNENPFVILTDASGANRVYGTQGLRFTSWDLDRKVVDEDGTVWTLDEEALQASDGRRLKRLPAQRAFWFGWQAAFPKTRLIK